MALNDNRANSAFAQLGTGPFPRLEVSRNDPEIQAILNKLVPGTIGSVASSPTVGERKKIAAPDMGLLQRISDSTTANISDAASLFQLLPETELAMQIYVASILSPKDMTSNEFNYSVEPGVFNSELSGALLDVIQNYFENVYKMSEMGPSILQDTLFYTGSYPLLVLPETSIDHVINSPNRVSLEAIADDYDRRNGKFYHVGLLGNPRVTDETKAVQPKGYNFGLESLEGRLDPRQLDYDEEVKPKDTAFDFKLKVVDNPNVLKLSRLTDKMRADRIQDILAVRKLSMESHRSSKGKVSQESLGAASDRSLFRRRQYRCEPVVAITPASFLKKESVGHPLVMKLPSESVIPVHVPSNPEEHLGYFVLLDLQGNPVVRGNEQDYYTDLATNISANKEMVSQLIQSTKRQAMGRDTGARQAEVEELERVYADIVETELTARLKAGVYGDNVKVSRPQEVYRIMLARALANQHTQLLYIPEEMMTYIAFDYNKYGVGQSLLAGSKILGGIRAMLMFADTMAAIKNSIGRTLLNIQLDPEDPDPSATVEFLVHEYAKVRQGTYPLGASNPIDIISYLQNAAVEVQVTGNTGYPETKMDIEDKVSNKAKTDQELSESLRKRHLMSLGLSPENVDAGANAEFATSIVANNLLLAKRVMVYQKKLSAFLEDFVTKYTLASQYLMDELRRVIQENIDKLTKEQKNDQEQLKQSERKKKLSLNSGIQVAASNQPSVATKSGMESLDDQATPGMSSDLPEVDLIIMDFLRALKITLPQPDTASLDSQMAAFDKYVDALDKALKAYMDPSFLDSLGMGEMAEVIEPTINAVKAHYIRQWLRNNNVLTELDDLTTFSDEDGPAMDMLQIHNSHVEGIAKSVLEYMKKIYAARKKRDPQYTEAKGNLGGEPGGAMDFGGGSPSGTDYSGGDTTDDLADDLDSAMGDLTDSDGGDNSDSDQEQEAVEETEESSSTTTTSSDGTSTTTSSSSSSSSSSATS